MQITETSWQVSVGSRGEIGQSRATGPSFEQALSVRPAGGVLDRIDAHAASHRENQRAIDAGIDALAEGRGTPADLLVLQQRVSDASLKVEFATRVVDRMAGGVKQLLSIQV